MRSNDNTTKDWNLYLRGRQYNQRLKPSYYETVNANLDFFSGNQWRNSESTTLEKPVFNIIKRILTFFVATLTSANVAVKFEPLAYTDNAGDKHSEGAEIANGEIANLLEKMKFSNKLRDAYFQAGQTGDVAFHFYFDPTKKPYRGSMGMDIQGEISLELVSGTNVFFGNANNPEVDLQPYIIISGRDMVENLKAEAEQYKEYNSDEINSDYDFMYEAGDASQIEVNADEFGKALYIIKYHKDKKTGTIKVSKCVQNTYIYKDVDTGLSYYPIAWLPWEKQRNQYHGRALVTGIIPNQIFINKMFAMSMFNMMHTAFPKAVYNADVITSWNNEIGQAIPVHGFDPSMNLGNIATYLEAGNMSSQITGLIDMAMAYTKETLGISDASMGNVNPTNTSAIIAVQKSTSIPLENIKHNGYEAVEDIGKILLDMIGTYYGTRPIIKDVEEQDPMTNEAIKKKEVTMYDFSQLKDLWLSTSVDVGESSYWSELASVQTLDNLLKNKYIDVVQYLERMPDGYIDEKTELINEIKDRMKAEQDAMNAQQQAQSPTQPTPSTQPQVDYEEMAQFFESLPQEVQDQLKELPPDQMEQAVNELMQQQ
jgi:hypothetical protein